MLHLGLSVTNKGSLTMNIAEEIRKPIASLYPQVVRFWIYDPLIEEVRTVTLDEHNEWCHTIRTTIEDEEGFETTTHTYDYCPADGVVTFTNYRRGRDCDGISSDVEIRFCKEKDLHSITPALGSSWPEGIKLPRWELAL